MSLINALLCPLIALGTAASAAPPAASPPVLPPESSWVECTSFTYEGRDPLFDKAPPTPDQFYNPILAGFYPDPSVCRAGNDFYLVHSSFSFYPGVPIFHSTDLVHWKQLGYILSRPSQLDLDGLPVSSGIFAPALSFHDGTFYMITTSVGGIGNFYVTAKDPAGPWSDPVKLPINGIDPSFFFDDDGRAYIVHNGPPPDNKPLYDGHRAIWLWDLSPDKKSIANGRILINGGVDISQKPSWIEGPHIFKHNGFYYLSAAEGGTGPNHSQVIFRSRSLAEPFLPFDGNPILTQRHLPNNRPDPVTCVGHAQLVDTPGGQWYATFLGVRPYEAGHSNIGRETFLLPVSWTNDWPTILPRGERLPRILPRPNLPAPATSTPPTTGTFTWRDDFASPTLDPAWSFLRTPRQQWWSLTARPGSLLIAPRPIPLDSAKNKNLALNGNPSFLARRLQHARFTAAATLALAPGTMPCEAGLAALQNDASYLFYYVRLPAGAPPQLVLERHTPSSATPEPLVTVSLPSTPATLELQVAGDGRAWSFSYRPANATTWSPLLDHVDARLLSTQSAGGFVGTMLGLYARPLDPASRPSATGTPAPSPQPIPSGKATGAHTSPQ